MIPDVVFFCYVLNFRTFNHNVRKLSYVKQKRDFLSDNLMKFSCFLKKTKDFKKVYKKGISRSGHYIVVIALKNELDFNRLGLSVSKKTGGAVKRNRIKRLIKEAYRINETLFAKGFDIVIVAKKSAGEANYKGIEGALLYLSRKVPFLTEVFNE